MRQTSLRLVLLAILALPVTLQAHQDVGVVAISPGRHPRAVEMDSMLAAFYRRRWGRPAWVDSGRISAQAAELVAVLARAEEDGLEPGDYGLPGLAILLQSEPVLELTRIDSLLTRGYLTFAAELTGGRVRPETVRGSWQGTRKSRDLVQLLEASLAAGAVGKSLRQLIPRHPGYQALRQALGRYRRLVSLDEWPVIPAGPAIRRGEADQRIPAIRRRLALECDVAPRLDSVVDTYDSALEEAIREYQETRGLEADGIIGAATIASLNVSPKSRVRQIIMNLERWRWLPERLEYPYVMINTGGFLLDYVDGDSGSFSSRVIVGRKDWQTPIVSSRITEVVFRPTWSVPTSIAAKELLPLIKRNPSYLRQQGIRVFKGGTEINPGAVAWQSIHRSALPYRFVQDPGPENPLGGVKFIFRSPFGVYVHDTPGRFLFTAPVRRFSHGCVRAERAAELALRLLPGWSGDAVLEAMSSGPERRVELFRDVPIHLVHWTAWVDEAGVVQFRDDGYGWDARLRAALGPGSKAN